MSSNISINNSGKIVSNGNIIDHDRLMIKTLILSVTVYTNLNRNTSTHILNINNIHKVSDVYSKSEIDTIIQNKIDSL